MIEEEESKDQVSKSELEELKSQLGWKMPTDPSKEKVKSDKLIIQEEKDTMKEKLKETSG